MIEIHETAASTTASMTGLGIVDVVKACRVGGFLRVEFLSAHLGAPRSSYDRDSTAN